jgi:hypothetical protein
MRNCAATRNQRRCIINTKDVSATMAASETTLHIKNMVCDRCVRVVREDLERLVGLEDATGCAW